MNMQFTYDQTETQTARMMDAFTPEELNASWTILDNSDDYEKHLNNQLI